MNKDQRLGFLLGIELLATQIMEEQEHSLPVTFIGPKLKITIEKILDQPKLKKCKILSSSFSDVMPGHEGVVLKEEGEGYAIELKIMFRGPEQLRSGPIKTKVIRWFAKSEIEILPNDTQRLCSETSQP